MSLRTGLCDECSGQLPSPAYMIKSNDPKKKPMFVCFACKMGSKRRNGEVKNKDSQRR